MRKSSRKSRAQRDAIKASRAPAVVIERIGAANIDPASRWEGFDPALAFPLDPVLRFRTSTWRYLPDDVREVKPDPLSFLTNGNATGGARPYVAKDRGTVVKVSGGSLSHRFRGKSGLALTPDEVTRLHAAIVALRQAIYDADFAGVDPDPVVIDAGIDAERDRRAFERNPDNLYRRRLARLTKNR